MSTTKTALEPAAAYVRMSSAKQDKSPERQLDGLPKWAATKGFAIQFHYQDSAVSGWKEREREDFLRMIDDAEAGKFKAVFVDEQSRFSRFKQNDSSYFLSRLARAGVKVFARLENRLLNGDALDDQIVAVVNQHAAHKESRDKGHRSLSGKLLAMRAGKVLSEAPFGFDRLIYNESGTPVHRVRNGEKFNCPKGWSQNLSPADDAEAVELMRGIFTQFAREGSLNAVVHRLNASGTASPRGSRWRVATVRQMLANPAYIGHRAYGKKSSGQFFTLADSGGLVDADGKISRRAPLLVVENTHEPIISRRVFDQCQQRLAEHAARPRAREAKRYPLTGILRCGHCGGPLHGGMAEKRYYRCSNSSGLGKSTCRGYSVSAEVIERYILAWLVAAISSPEHLARLTAVLESRQRTIASSKALRGGLATRLDKARQRVETITRNMMLLADPQAAREAAKLLRDATAERDRLMAEFSATSAKAKGKGLVSAAMLQLDRLRELLDPKAPEKQRRAYLATFEAITITWTRCGSRRGRGPSKHKCRVDYGTITLKANSPLAAMSDMR